MDWNQLFSDLFSAGAGALQGMNQGGTVINNYTLPDRNGIDLSNPLVLGGGLLLVLMFMKK